MMLEVLDQSIQTEVQDLSPRVTQLEVFQGLFFTLPTSSATLNIVLEEVPSGAIDGVNMVFTTLAHFADIWVYLGGLRMKHGVDYNVTGANQITFLYPPFAGAVLIVDYVPA